MENKTIGLIAGNGRFPLTFAREATKNGYEVIVFAIIGETFEEIHQCAHKVYWFEIGNFEKILQVIKESGVKQVVMAGKIMKTKMFSGIALDDRWKRLLANLKAHNDDSLLGGVVRELEREGIEVKDSTLFLTSHLAQPGVLTKKKPDQRDLVDIQFGYYVAKKIAGLDIGQTVVVKNRAVLAVEAIEGTDKAILRGGELGRGDIVVVKVSKPNQDMRFDIPVVGLNTLRYLIEARARVLAIESRKTLILDREKLIELAEANNLSIYVIGDEFNNEKK
jgi:DUF1009 family protein